MKKKVCKLLFLMTVLLLLLSMIPLTFSKYESQVTIKSQPQVAFYLLKEGYQYQDISLPKIKPDGKSNVYRFTISNYEGTNRLETKLKYDLKIVTTTNLPLEYKLYLNENPTDSGAKNIILDDQINKDEDGTYFRTMTTSTQYFSYDKDQLNTYHLVVVFPDTYKEYKYQDIVENIQITIDSKQIVKGE